MSSLINKVKSHLPHHDATHGNPNLTHANPSSNSTIFVNPNGPLNSGLNQPIIESKAQALNHGNLIGAHDNLKPGYVAPTSTLLGTQPAPLQTGLQSTNIQASRTIVEPTVHRNVIEKPAIVKETLLPQERIEIQPVIHREREQKEVHKVIQPMRERDIMPTKIVQATLADQVRAPIVQSDAAYQQRSREADTQYIATKEYANLKSETIQKPAIVEEHIHKTIVEEVQPVLYKETIVPVIVQETQPIYEKIIEAPTIITEQRAVRDLGTQYVSSTSFNDQRAYAQTYQQGVVPQAGFIQQGQQGGFIQQTTIAQTITPNQYIDQNKLNQQQNLYQKTPLQPNINNTRLV